VPAAIEQQPTGETPSPHAARRSRVPGLRLQAAVAAGGTAGAVVRVMLERAVPPTPGSWPWATFLANVAGTAMLGYVATRLQERLPPSSYPRPVLGTGFCGALTTFSAFQLELIRLARAGQAGLALAYLAASLGAGLAGVYLATALTRRVALR
jgi:CrcB protein